MGMLVDGSWRESSSIRSDQKGSYDRLPRTFRDFIEPGHEKYQPESGRYHLYVSYACPWAARTLIYRSLKALEDHITVSVVHPDMLDNGWSFSRDYSGATGDHLFDAQYLMEIYQRADPTITTSVTVPVLWDKKSETIVNNESSEIIRMFNTGFNKLTGDQVDYYPREMRERIDHFNDKIYETVNNGVYRAGFAKSQEAYDTAVDQLFQTLDELETLLGDHRYVLGERLTEVDLRLIPTLLRFDIVYATHFKCNVRRIVDYPNLSRYTRELYRIPAIKETTHFDHIKRHYYYSHPQINPHRIIPRGPSEFI